MKAPTLLYCSAHMGVTFALIPPVPSPMITMAAMSPPYAVPDCIDAGVAVATSIVNPTM